MKHGAKNRSNTRKILYNNNNVHPHARTHARTNTHTHTHTYTRIIRLAPQQLKTFNKLQ